MNQDPIIVKLLTQSKPVQYIFMALSVLFVLWGIRQMFSRKDVDEIKNILPGKAQSKVQ